MSTQTALNTPTRPIARSTWRTWYAVGLTSLAAYSAAIGWQAQLVSYPLYRSVGADEFPAYHLRYNDSIPLVVIVPGFLTFLGAIALAWARPPWIGRRIAWLVATCGATSLLATVLWAIPRHGDLDNVGLSEPTVDSLLQANMLRTAALTVAAVALGWVVGRRLTGQPDD